MSAASQSDMELEPRLWIVKAEKEYVHFRFEPLFLSVFQKVHIISCNFLK